MMPGGIAGTMMIGNNRRTLIIIPEIIPGNKFPGYYVSSLRDLKSVAHISFIISDSVFIQKFQIFIFERMLLMMNLLISDVADGFFNC